MPEGDSYTRAAARLIPVLVGATIEAVDGTPSIRRSAARLVDSRIDRVRTNGKHLLIDTEAGLTIHVWLGMPGRVRVFEGEGTARTSGSTRLVIQTARGVAKVEAAPLVEVDRTPVIDRQLERLGADVLAESFDWDRFRQRSNAAPPEMSVADYLLDQRILAGVGNEYKCEVLFLEGLHPTTTMRAIDGVARDRLAERARRIMLPNSRRSGRSTTGWWAGTEAWVYDRAGRPCRRCGSAIEADHLGHPHPRITYWCPSCQPER